MGTIAPPLTFDLRYRKEARSKVGGKMKANPGRYAELPDVPPQYESTVGDYSAVAKVAVRLNDAQLRSGFLDYLFFPEVSTAPHGSEMIADA